VPYALWKFVVLPAMFLPLGKWAVVSVLVNSVLAELLTNLHSFVMIAPNHAGEDLYQFDSPIADRDEFSIRQIIGSTNYACGSDVGDFLQGWLNYQVEHHLWPNVPLLAYQRMQPRVKALCEKYGVPYKQESVWARVRKTADIMVGAASQKTFGHKALGASGVLDAADASDIETDGAVA
jgi:fatty acid desaturase